MNTVKNPTYPSLLDAAWPSSSEAAKLARNALLALLGAALLTISAKIQIPFWPVPLTMQTFVVLVLGVVYGLRLGSATMVVYLVLGAIGLPVFAGTPEKGIGIGYMQGATGGYLIGFVCAAAMCGWLAERGWDRSWLKAAIAMILGHLLILALGWARLAALIGPAKAYYAGVAPFYTATLLKTALAVAVLPTAWKLLGARRSAPPSADRDSGDPNRSI